MMEQSPKSKPFDVLLIIIINNVLCFMHVHQGSIEVVSTNIWWLICMKYSTELSNQLQVQAFQTAIVYSTI